MQTRALLLLLISVVALCPLTSTSLAAIQRNEPLEPSRKDIPAIAKSANGAVVSIIMSDKDGKLISQGSGFLVSKDGVVVTNYHVIAEGTSAVVKLPDGAFYVVDGVVASDKTRDMAVIKAHGSNFRTLILGNSDRLQVGEEVVAIGNPLSLESTVSNGIVSGIRAAETLGGKFLQITTPISPGSSGGPLFNMAGEVVGITTLKLEGGENLNFAIPVNDAKRLLLGYPSKVQNFPNETESVEKPISEQNDASPEQQALTAQTECALSANRFLLARGWKAGDGSDFENHFNSRLNKCFVMVSGYLPNDDFRTIDLYDAVEGRHYATYNGHSICDGAITGNPRKCALDSGSIWFDGDDSRRPADFTVGFRGLLYGGGAGDKNTQKAFLDRVRTFMAQ